MKTDDRRSFPLCADSPSRVGCHTQHSLLLDMTLDYRRETEARYVEKMQARAAAAGWDIFKEAA